ncbi:MAG: WG repeat-containing protein [Muribaculaceae bacterium]|nr:WG repeat-containing protein [Muribaculaceae bacterium]
MNTKFKKSILLGAIGLMGLTVVSCGEKSASDSKTYLAVKEDNTGLWSMIAPDGKMLFENEFKQNISDAVEGLFIVPENNKKSLYKADRVPVMLEDYTNLLDVGEPSEGKVVLINQDEVIQAIKTTGERLFSLPPDIITCHASFKNGLLGVCNDKAQWGFVNEKGEEVIACRYISVTPFSENHAIVAEYRNDRIKLSIIDKTGTVTAVVQNYLFLIPSSTTFYNGRIPVVNADNQLGFLTVDGVFEKCSYKVTGISDVTDYGFIFQIEGGKYGAMDYQGEILVQPRFDGLAFIPGSKNYIARIQNRYSELDDKGEKIMDFTDYKEMRTGTKSFPIIASTGKRFELLNNQGKPITPMDFADVNSKIEFSKGILNPTGSDLFRFNVEIANYLLQVYRGFTAQLDMSLDVEEFVSDEAGNETELVQEEEQQEVEAAPAEAPAVKEAKPQSQTKSSAAQSAPSASESKGVTGDYNFGYAMYNGQLKNGKPNGRGKLVFTAAHTDNVRNYTAESGDYIEGNFTNGKLDNGSLYKADGSKVKTIY